MCNLSDLLVEKGIELGHQKGICERNQEFVKRLIALKMDDTFIANATGLSIEEVSELRE